MSLPYKPLPRMLRVGAVAAGCVLLFPGTAPVVPGSGSRGGVVQQSISSIAQFLSTKGEVMRSLADTWEVQRFYTARNFLPVWVGPSDQDNAATATKFLEHAAEEGLNPADYHVDAIHLRQKAVSASAPAEMDMLLTDGVLAYIRDMRQGRVRRHLIGFPVGLPQVQFNSVEELSRAIGAHRLQPFLLGLEPAHREYARLKGALARYKAIAAAGGWPLIESAKQLDLASSDPRVGLLRKRLATEDPTFAAKGVYEKDLVYALARYQHRNHLNPGPLSRQTLETLNVPASMRADQIAANMERWRWFSQVFKGTRIEVNSADTTLVAYLNGVPLVKSNIIVGKPASPTPAFTATAIAIVLNPSWNIPTSIARREILPKAARNHGYLARQHIVADRPGGGLRQLPGRWNALGRIKVDMPNRFASYLHDTSTPSLFARQERHLSHGCMRVEQIKALAAFLLTDDSSAAVQTIDATIRVGKTRRFALKKPVQVYVGYWTAFADESGVVGFAPDVYGLDQKVLSAMRIGSKAGERFSALTECSNR